MELKNINNFLIDIRNWQRIVALNIMLAILILFTI